MNEIDKCQLENNCRELRMTRVELRKALSGEHAAQPSFTCSNLHAQCSDLQSECECLRRERDIAQDELTRVQFGRAIQDAMYDTRGKQLERHSEMQEQLCHERNEARDWARRLYGRLEWWGGVCECGGIKETNDEVMKCATCGKQGLNRGWD